MSAGGVTGTFSMLANGIAAGTTFLMFPKAYAWSWAWLVGPVLPGYGPFMHENGWWIWGIILAISIFALTRVLLLFGVSFVGLMIALKAFLGNRSD